MSNFRDRLLAKMSGSLGKAATFVSPKAKQKSRHTLVTNRWDERVWKNVRNTDQVDKLIYDLDLGDEVHGGTRKGFEAAPELVHDLFMSFYKAAPELVEKRDLDRDVYVVHKMVKELLDNPKIRDFQDMSAGKEMESLIALGALADTVRDILSQVPPPPPPPQPKPQPKPKQKQEPGEASEGQPGQPGEPGEGQPGGTQPSEAGEPGTEAGDGPAGPTPVVPDDSGEPGENEPGDADGEAEGEGEGETEGEGDGEEFDPEAEADAAEADWQKAYDDLLDKVDLERAMHRGLDAAGAEVEELDKLRKGIGLEDGEWKLMSPEKRLAMANYLRTPQMKMLADVIGRMKRFALGVKATRINDVPHEVYDVEFGNDLRLVVRSQFALLATPETTLEFYRRFAEGELLQYKLQGTEEVGKGPIVICIDKSGSMNGAKFAWAMGVAEALRRSAAEEGRDYHAIFFGADNDRHHFDFPKGQGPFEKVIAFLSVAADGGTQFAGVLTDALAKASTAFDGEARGKADIVFLTDGLANLTDEWITGYNAERARVGVRQYSVFITGAPDTNGQSPASILDRISDVVIPVRDLQPESVREIFAKV